MIRKILSLALALSLVLSSGVGMAFAIEPPTIVADSVELAAALADPAIDSITFGGDIAVTSKVIVDRPLTIDGAGHTLSAASPFSTDNSSKHLLGIQGVEGSVVVSDLKLDSAGSAFGIQAFESTDVDLVGVEAVGSKGAGVTVNGSDVAATDLVVSGSAWGSVNVDPGVGVEEPSVFTLGGESLLAGPAQIWSDGRNVSDLGTVSVTAPGYKEVSLGGSARAWGISSVVVSNAEELVAAVTGPFADSITFGGDIAVTSKVIVDRPLTIDGAGHTLSAASPFSTDNSSKHLLGIQGVEGSVVVSDLKLDSAGSAFGIQAFESTDVDLVGVEAVGSKGAGVTVNGSDVAATDLVVSGSAWGSVNVDPGVGVEEPSVFTLGGESLLAGPAQIWSDGRNVSDLGTVSVTAPGYKEVSLGGSARAWGISSVVVSNAEELVAAVTGPFADSITFGGDIAVTSKVIVDRPLTIDGAGHTLSAASPFSTDNSSKHLLGIQGVEGSVVVSDLKLDSAGSAFGIQAFESTDVDLVGVEAVGSKGAGVTVNGSDVAATDLVVSGSAWGSVNVDPGVGVEEPSVFTLGGTGSLLLDTVQIWSDGRNPGTVSVTAENYDRLSDTELAAVWGSSWPSVYPNLAQWSDTRVYQVSFIGAEGQRLGGVQEVRYGFDAVAPAPPEVEGKHFVEWTPSPLNITGSLNIVAVYAINEYTVEFMNGEELIASVVVEHGAAAVAPEAPAVEGYTFVEWDADFSAVTGDLTVNAVYAINEYTVEFMNGEELIASVVVEHGAAAVAPEAPAVEGYTFVEWDADFSAITGDLTVNAVYYPVVEPIAGETKTDTAAKIAVAAYPDGVGTVILATGNHWADALGGSALAGALDAPMLLVTGDTLDASVAAALEQLNPENIIILGGRYAVSEALEDVLAADYDVERIWGETQYDTADLVAARVLSILGDAWDGTAVFTTGANYVDALAISPLTAAKDWPVFLVDPAKGELSDGAKAIVDDIESAIIIGGRYAVSTAIEAELSGATVVRIAGELWTDTAAMVAEFGVANGLSYERIAIATGDAPYDALTGGVLQALRGSVLLLTPSNSLSDAAADLIEENASEIKSVTYFGGVYAVSQDVRDAVADILGAGK